MKNLIILLGASLLFTFNLEAQNQLVRQIESTHKSKKVQKQDWIAFDIKLNFGGKERLNGTVYSKTNSSKMRLDYGDGVSAYFDGTDTYLTGSSDKKAGSVIFDLFTWQYFFMAPYKLSDPGTNWSEIEEASMNGENYKTSKLTFDPGTGVSHRDWYLVYADEYERLAAMAYIVTMGKSTEKANEEPHAISYSDFQNVKGIPFAGIWKFWDWNEQEGLGKQLGEAQISNIQFGKKNVDIIKVPVGAEKVVVN